MRSVRLLALALVAPALLGVSPADAALAYEVYWVETSTGHTIRIDTRRDTAFDPQPVLLTYSPYTVLQGSQPAADAYATRFNRFGIARAVAHVVGTGHSDGCWDYGGAIEQQTGVDVVNAFGNAATIPWGNGIVGMIGVSYDGTTATMVAARGDDVPGLRAIVPIAAISRWYSYAFHDGVRYFLNSEHPGDEGFDTPLVFDAAFGRTVGRDRTDPYLIETAASRANECGAAEHTYEAYRRDPVYSDFWLERDYRKDAASFRAAALIVHGWQDYNVKQEEAVALYEALPLDDPETPEIEGVPDKHLWLTQEPHADGVGPGYAQLETAFIRYHLTGVDAGYAIQPSVVSRGRDAAGPLVYVAESAWPPVGSGTLELHLGRWFDPIDGAPQAGLIGSRSETGVLSTEPQDTGAGWTHLDPATITEEHTLNDPLNAYHGYYSLFHQSAPLTRDVRIVGAAELRAWVTTSTPGQHLSPVLVDVYPDGTLSAIDRGFANTDFRNGLDQHEPATGRMQVDVRFLPQDYTVRAGHRIGLMLQGSNTVWAVPGSPGLTSYAMGPVAGWTSVGTHLRIPIADADAIATDPPFVVE